MAIVKTPLIHIRFIFGVAEKGLHLPHRYAAHTARVPQSQSVRLRFDSSSTEQIREYPVGSRH
jgi:hypothetical protein